MAHQEGGLAGIPHAVRRLWVVSAGQDKHLGGVHCRVGQGRGTLTGPQILYCITGILHW